MCAVQMCWWGVRCVADLAVPSLKHPLTWMLSCGPACRSLMGVCPQFDILWGELSGEEHLLIYGRIKGLPAADVRRQASQLLE